MTEGAALPVVRVIVGPTAAGKSALALHLAARYPTVIVSADSRQVYRGFDVGTAKASAAERAAVPHRGIDVADPTERYSAAAWAESAAEWIAEAQRAGREPMIVGGTGFYIRALVKPLFEAPAMEPGRRHALERVLGQMPLEELARWCAVLDPGRAHLGRTQLLRSVEVALLTGTMLSELHARDVQPARVRARYLIVDPGGALHARVEARTRAMLDRGWPEEVAALRELVPEAAPAWNASGYRTVRAMVEGTLSPDAALEQIVIETRQYAKRQRTWFRHQLPPEATTRVDPTAPGWEAVVERWWHEERT